MINKARHQHFAITSQSFDNKFTVPDIKTLEDVGTFFSARSGKYEVFPLYEQTYNKADLSIAEIDDIVLIGTKWSNSASSIAATSRNKLCINIVLNGTTEAEHPELGVITTHSNQARIASMKAGTILKNSTNKQSIELAIPLDQLERCARTLFKIESDKPLMFEPVVDLESFPGQAIIDLVSLLQLQVVESPEIKTNSILMANTKELVFNSVLNLLQHNYRTGLLAKKETTHPRVVLLAEEFMRANADLPITIEMLAKEVGCSGRALHSLFRQVRDTTPISALRDIRLEKARSELLSDATSVTACAIKWGFTNLGRFAKAYEAKFLEKPSETLQRNKFYIMKNSQF